VDGDISFSRTHVAVNLSIFLISIMHSFFEIVEYEQQF